MSGPLEGITVVDCSRGTAGPRTTGLLSDYGAKVIWVEPKGGDPWRERLAVQYSVFNRGKTSVELDLTQDHDREVLKNILEGADLFVQSWSDGVAEQLNMDYETIHEEFPALVYCSISGWGPGSFGESLPGYEALIHAVLGTMALQPTPSDGPCDRHRLDTENPCYIDHKVLPFASIGAAYLAIIGSLAAIYRRNKSGVGRYVETSLLDGALAYHQINWAEIGDPISETEGVGTDRRIISGHFECEDGEYICIMTGAIGSFNNLIKSLDLEDDIPISASGVGMGETLTQEQEEILNKELPKIFRTAPSDEWIRRLTLETDVAVVPANKPLDVFDEPQIEYNDAVVEVNDPVNDHIQQVGHQVTFSESSPKDPDPAPVPGENSNLEIDRSPSDGIPSTAPADNKPSKKPLLHDINVLDFGHYFAGPHASRILSDFGATVIKLEDPPIGDHLRFLERPFFVGHARKQSIGVDLRDEKGQEIGHELAKWADIIHHNLRPGAARNLQMHYQTISGINPEIVYQYQPGWGSSGPERNRQSFSPLPSAYAGASHEVAGKGNSPVGPVANDDPAQSLLSAATMLMGLIHRQKSGEGQYIETPQINASLAHVAHIVRGIDETILGSGNLDSTQKGTGPFTRIYETYDSWVCIAAITDDEIKALDCAVKAPILQGEYGPKDVNIKSISKEITSKLANEFINRKTSELVNELQEAGVPAVEPTLGNDVESVFLNDPEHHETERVTECDHQSQKKIRAIDRLVRVSDTNREPLYRAPELSEHKDEILSMLGYSEQEIRELVMEDIVVDSN